MKKPYLVDVPVCMMIWTRPELQRQTFAPIAIARPSIVFLVSDGGRNEEEWNKIYQSRKICEDAIDWDCTVYKLYMDKNHGMYTMGSLWKEFVFSKVDRIVFFEDDTLADPSYFRFCAELLERYKDDLRIEAIEGQNQLGIYDRTGADYFFVRGGRSSGSAYWKRSIEFMKETEWMYDPYILEILKGKYGKKFVEKVKTLREKGYIDNHPPGQEDICPVTKVVGHCLTIVPARNHVLQMGATDDATHGVDFRKLDKKTQQMYMTPVYQCEFPLKHPRYVVCDEEYCRLVVKQQGNKLERLRRRIVTICKRLYYGDGKILWQKFVDRVIKRKKEIET